MWGQGHVVQFIHPREETAKAPKDGCLQVPLLLTQCLENPLLLNFYYLQLPSEANLNVFRLGPGRVRGPHAQRGQSVGVCNGPLPLQPPHAHAHMLPSLPSSFLPSFLGLAGPGGISWVAGGS